MTKENKNVFKLNLQHFADSAEGGTQDIDDNNNTGVETDPAANLEGQEPPKTFTQDEVTKIVQREVAKVKKSTEPSNVNPELTQQISELTQKFEQSQNEIKRANTEKELLANGIDPTKLQYAMLDVEQQNIEDIAKYANESIFKIVVEDNTRAKEVTTQNHTQIKRMVGHNFGKDD